MATPKNTPVVDLEALARELAPRVATLVLARLATALGATEAPFSTRRGFEPPEFLARHKSWKATAPTIPGAVKLGRWWSVSRAAYAAWISAQNATGSVASTPTPISTPGAANDADDAGWTPRAALAAAGVRATR